MAKPVARLGALLPLLVFGAPVAANAVSVAALPPVKTIHIYNNSTRRLYPVFETNLTPADEWLQGIFKAVNIKRDTYAHPELYRVYVNPNRGIAPGASVVIDIPFYSQLVNNPKATRPNQYIDWWNGTRIYLYDDKAAVTKNHNADSARPVSPLTESITCNKKSICEPLSVFFDNVGLPVNDPNQLMEYTFADVVTGVGTPFPVDLTHVDYDISYVDQVYLPLAIEPLDNKSVGFIGTVQPLPEFRRVLKTFLKTWEGWPSYVGTPPYPDPRIPGAYNVFIGGPDLTKPGVTVDQMRHLWRTCTGTADGSPECQDIRSVDEFFQTNYAKYLKLNCNPHLELTEKLLIQHVYGWVPFNENCENAAAANALKDTPGYNDTFGKYIDLQYLPSRAFNPFVQLIHGVDELNMNAYAFSIDDAVGNMNEVGNGLIIAFGGGDGLANGKPFDKSKVIHVNLGAPVAGSRNQWKSYGVCTAKPDQDINPKFLSFNIYTVDYPCKITVTDRNDAVYQLVVRNEPPRPVLGCGSSSSPEWCANTNVKKDKEGAWYLETPSPAE